MNIIDRMMKAIDRHETDYGSYPTCILLGENDYNEYLGLMGYDSYLSAKGSYALPLTYNGIEVALQGNEILTVE